MCQEPKMLAADTSDQPAEADPEVSAFAALVACAVSSMAARTGRNRLELAAALRGARLDAGSPYLRAALLMLRAQGGIADLLPLANGDLLLTLTKPDTANLTDAGDESPAEAGGCV